MANPAAKENEKAARIAMNGHSQPIEGREHHTTLEKPPLCDSAAQESRHG